MAWLLALQEKMQYRRELARAKRSYKYWATRYARAHEYAGTYPSATSQREEAECKERAQSAWRTYIGLRNDSIRY